MRRLGRYGAWGVEPADAAGTALSAGASVAAGASGKVGSSVSKGLAAGAMVAPLAALGPPGWIAIAGVTVVAAAISFVRAARAGKIRRKDAVAMAARMGLPEAS